MQNYGWNQSDTDGQMYTAGTVNKAQGTCDLGQVTLCKTVSKSVIMCTILFLAMYFAHEYHSWMNNLYEVQRKMTKYKSLSFIGQYENRSYIQSLLRTPLGLTNAVLNWKVSRLQRLIWMKMTNLGLRFAVLNREVSSCQRCPLRKVPLYWANFQTRLGPFIRYLPCLMKDQVWSEKFAQ
jgi:hypothetical protein